MGFLFADYISPVTYGSHRGLHSRLTKENILPRTITASHSIALRIGLKIVLRASVYVLLRRAM